MARGLKFRIWKAEGVAKTKALISFAVSTKLISVFVFKDAKIRFSHVAAHIYMIVEQSLPTMGIQAEQCLYSECLRHPLTNNVKSPLTELNALTIYIDLKFMIYW